MLRRFALPLLLLSAPLAAPLAAQGEPADRTLEERVLKIEDEAAIARMLVEYGAYIDGRDYASYAGLFAEDGEWVGGFGTFTGRTAIRQMLEDNLGIPEPGFENISSFHMITNPLVTVTGDTAQASSKYLFWLRGPDGSPYPLISGRYEDEWVRVEGEWRISRRNTVDLMPYRDPETGEGSPPVMPTASLAARLQEAEDILAIQRVIVEYAARIDAQDFDAYVDLFAEDGIWQNGNTVHQGRDAIKAMLVGIFGTPPEGYVNAESYHLVSNPQVDVHGDRATARSRHLLIMRGEGGSPTPELTGLYEDEFVRVNGEWKIAKRVDNPIMPTREEWLVEMQARNAGQ